MKRSTGLLWLAAILMAWHFDGSLPTPLYVALGAIVVAAWYVGTVRGERAAVRESTEVKERARYQESAVRHERAASTARTDKQERAGKQESTEGTERPRWLAVSGMHTIETRAATALEALDVLRGQPANGFSIVSIALPFGGGEVVTMRTSALMGQRWGRPHDARRLIAQAVTKGLPDTTTEDLRNA